jgi:hypothetical protein
MSTLHVIWHTCFGELLTVRALSRCTAEQHVSGNVRVGGDFWLFFERRTAPEERAVANALVGDLAPVSSRRPRRTPPPER